MKRVVLIAAIAVLSGIGFLTAEFAVAADAPVLRRSDGSN